MTTPSQRKNRVATADLFASPKWVSVLVAGKAVASTRDALLWRARWPMAYYFPMTDVAEGVLSPAGEPRGTEWGPEARFDVRVGDRVAPSAAWSYLAPPDHLAALAGRVAFDWHAVDSWFEESEEVFVHPRDPFVRVDALPSTRHVQVVVDGVTVADTRAPVLLFETGLVTRYYIPKRDTRLDLLCPSDTTTRCPY